MKRGLIRVPHLKLANIRGECEVDMRMMGMEISFGLLPITDSVGCARGTRVLLLTVADIVGTDRGKSFVLKTSASQFVGLCGCGALVPFVLITSPSQCLGLCGFAAL